MTATPAAPSQTRGAWLLARAARGDTEAASAAAILLDPVFARDGRAWKHVHEREQEVWWEEMLAEGTWSSGERALLRLGWNLWNGGCDVDVSYLAAALGDGFLSVALAAIEARHSSCTPLPLTARQRAALTA